MMPLLGGAALGGLPVYNRASLACAARLADTLCSPEATFGRLDSY